MTTTAEPRPLLCLQGPLCLGRRAVSSRDRPCRRPVAACHRPVLSRFRPREEKECQSPKKVVRRMLRRVRGRHKLCVPSTDLLIASICCSDGGNGLLQTPFFPFVRSPPCPWEILWRGILHMDLVRTVKKCIVYKSRIHVHTHTHAHKSTPRLRNGITPSKESATPHNLRRVKYKRALPDPQFCPDVFAQYPRAGRVREGRVGRPQHLTAGAAREPEHLRAG